MQNNILVLPSRYDGWGVVVLEAMSRGMALISSNKVGATKEYIKHNYNGRIFDIETKNIDKEIKFFTEEIGNIKLFGERNRKIFNKNLCNTANAVNKFKKIFNKLKLNESKKINNLINDYVIYGAGEAGKQIYSSLEAINRKVFCFIG